MRLEDSGADFLPMKLVVALVAASVLIVIMASGIDDLLGAYSASQARATAQEIAGAALVEYSTGCPGEEDGKSISVAIPPSVRLMVFGAAPAENGSPGRIERSYYIEYADGERETFVADVPFADDDFQGVRDQPVVLFPGNYRIEIRPVLLNGSIKAGIRAEAA